MKIELLPWATTETSISLPSPKKKRRRKSKSNGADDDACARHTTPNNSLSLVASFLDERDTTMMDPMPQQWKPSISLTLPHQVVLLSAGSGERESSSMVYVTRSTKSNAFVASRDGSSTSIPPPIPCLCDGRQRLYACMDGNQMLVSWTSDQTPEEGVTVLLKSAALSLSIEKGGLAFGSLADGALYVARLTSGGNKEWEVQYPQSNEVPVSSSHGTRHVVATFATRRTNNPEPNPTTLVQILADMSCLHLLQYRRRRPGGGAPPGHEYGVTTRSSVPHSAGTANIRWIGRHGTVAVLAYQSGSELVCLSVNLLQGTLRSIFRLPRLPLDVAWPQKIGLLGPLLVVLTPAPSGGGPSDLQLYDAQHGGLLSNQSLLKVVDGECVVSLLTDSKSRVALVVAGPDETVRIVSSALVVPSSLVSHPISLAQGLMGGAEGDTGGATGSGSNRSSQEEDDAVQRAMAVLRHTLVEIQRKDAVTRREKFLSTRFLEATHIVAERENDPNRPHRTKSMMADAPPVHMTNPQEPMEKLNGCNGNKKRKISSEPDTAYCDHHETRIQTATLEPRLLPPLFVESATKIAIEVLQLGELPESIRNDARKMLRQLVRTGLASARSTMPNLSAVLRALESTEEGGINVAYSPVDLAFDVCRYCGDLTEQQMVSTLHYVITTANAYHLCLYLQRNVKLLGSSDDQAIALLNEWKRSLLLHQKKDRHRTEPDDDDATLTSLFGKMVRVATLALLCKLSSHSECNESLLRNSLSNTFAPAELAYVYRALVGLLGSSAFPLPVGTSKIRLLQWLTHTTEALTGRSKTKDDRSDALLAQQIVGDEVHKTDSLQPLKGLVDAAVIWERKAMAAAQSQGGGTSKRGGASKLPLYQIERLFF